MLTTILRIGLIVSALITIKCEDLSQEAGFKTVYNNYKQCEDETDMLACLKLKALKLVDRALSINNIPIVEGISLTKKEDGRSLDDGVSAPIDESNLPSDSEERNRKLDFLLWDRIKQFIETRSLQLKVNKLFFNDDTEMENVQDGRGKKDKNKGMYVYMMMMKGGMMALAYKGLALLAGKALLVSKIALTLALLVAIKKLFSGGHHSHQKTTYEIVKTPIITHSHQYQGGANQNGHYGNDFSVEGPSYARSLDNPEEVNRRMGLRTVDAPPSPTRYVTHIIETVEGRSLPDSFRQAHGRSITQESPITESTLENFSVPYAHLVAYKSQLKSNLAQEKSQTTNNVSTSRTE